MRTDCFAVVVAVVGSCVVEVAVMKWVLGQAGCMTKYDVLTSVQIG